MYEAQQCAEAARLGQHSSSSSRSSEEAAAAAARKHFSAPVACCLANFLVSTEILKRTVSPHIKSLLPRLHECFKDLQK